MIELQSIWFYTLSTSAQVLAALAGLFAVFVVYKLQSLRPWLENARPNIIKILQYFSCNIKDYHKFIITELELKSDKGLIAIFNEILEIKKNNPERIGVLFGQPLVRDYDLSDKTKADFEEKVNFMENIIRSLKLNLIFGFFVISICIIELAFTNYLQSQTILVATLVVIILYMVLIAGNIYKISKV